MYMYIHVFIVKFDILLTNKTSTSTSTSIKMKFVLIHVWKMWMNLRRYPRLRGYPQYSFNQNEPRFTLWKGIIKSSKIASVTTAKPVLTYNIHLYSPSFVTKSTNISYMNYLLVMYYKIISWKNIYWPQHSSSWPKYNRLLCYHVNNNTKHLTCHDILMNCKLTIPTFIIWLPRAHFQVLD